MTALEVLAVVFAGFDLVDQVLSACRTWALLAAVAVVVHGCCQASGLVRILSGHQPLTILRPHPDTALTSTDTRPDTSGQPKDTT